jgi:hypothetical protein
MKTRVLHNECWSIQDLDKYLNPHGVGVSP